MALVLDRERPTLVTEEIGRTRGYTPEGYLLCEGVRIARTGPMQYAPFELPHIDPGKDTMLTVDRDADVLFDANAMASFAGKDVTLHHPDQMITPGTWRDVAVGVVLNPRRGTGADSEFLLADLLVKRPDAIKAVLDGLVEVSCGYDCEYAQVRPGLGRQERIVGNHVALVTRGRCGPVCSIGDSEMAAKQSLVERIRAAFTLKDSTALDKVLAEIPAAEDGIHNHVHVHLRDEDAEQDKDKDEGETKDEVAPEQFEELGKNLTSIGDSIRALGDELRGGLKDCDDRLKRLEGLKDEAGDDKDHDGDKEGDTDKDEDNDKDTTDSADLADEWRDTVARGAMILPGFKPRGTFDAKAKRKATADVLCGFRRAILKTALVTDKRKAAVERTGIAAAVVDSASCDAIALTFRAASEFARDAANKDVLTTTPAGPDLTGGKMDATKLQATIEAWRKAQVGLKA